MISHRCSIVLSTPRIDLPENPNVIEMINGIIHNNLTNLEYFGMLLDNQADNIDEDMLMKMEATSYFTLHFDLSNIELDDYSSEDEQINLFANLILSNDITEIRSDDKDVTIFVNI